MVDALASFESRNVPPQIRKYLQVDENKDGYFPTVFLNDFWLLKEKLVPVNETVPVLNLTITVAPLSLMKWQVCPYAQPV